jgi:hypothetical protein
MGGLVELVDGRERLVGFGRGAVGDVVEGDGPEQSCGRVGGQPEPLVVRPVEQLPVG